MADHNPRALLVFVLFEASLLGLLAVGLARGFTSSAGMFSGLSAVARVGALLVVLIELVIPLAVYVDVYRRPDDPDWVWVHAVMMPVLNLLGFVAYLLDRRHSGE